MSGRILMVNATFRAMNHLANRLAMEGELLKYIRVYANQGRVWERIVARIPIAVPLPLDVRWPGWFDQSCIAVVFPTLLGSLYLDNSLITVALSMFPVRYCMVNPVALCLCHKSAVRHHTHAKNNYRHTQPSFLFSHSSC